MGCGDPEEFETRRDFLTQAAGLATGLGLAPAAHGPRAPLLPTIKLGKHEVTRLILGANPIYGYSHFNRMLSAHQTDWHTPDRVMALLKRAEAVGINTWQNSYHERSVADLERYRGEGGTIQWLCLGKGDWDKFPERVDEAARRRPLGIAPHGSLAERCHREGKLDVLTDLLKRIRQAGVLVGLSAHNPALIELSEEKGWDVDYYMTCLYYLTRPRAEFQKILGGDLPLGEIYLPSDPPRMLAAMRAAKKPCLMYKVLAAGRRIDSPAEIRRCFQSALGGAKPTDAMIVGMYNPFGDQLADNAAIVRELLGAPK
jgi:hypothetical protein